ncbi:hypothetical protein IKP85_05275 [bacterium]|nr:hypothetical protein [bacterium]
MYCNIIPNLAYRNPYMPQHRYGTPYPSYGTPVTKPQKVVDAEAKLYLYSNPENLINDYKNNPEYQKLLGNSFFNTKIGQQNLINIIANLEYSKNRTTVNNFYYPIGYFDGGISKKMENADITKCLKNIEKIANNKHIAQSIKDYAIANSGNLRYQIISLNAINNIPPENIQQIEQALTNPLTFVYF